jgi:tRNA-specific 2-thiouridylase
LKIMKKEKRKKTKVIIAMSGGIDSSVAAALLKRAGFDLIGVFMKFWKPRINTDSNAEGESSVSYGGGAELGGFENRCCTSEAETRARKVAKILKIPFYVFNFEKEFKKRIVDYFLKGYKKGITPNPCVFCNKEIKFGLLLEKALKLGADYVATGHYARTNKLINSTIVENINRIKLVGARDKNKDQSYFLWMLNQKQLNRILFPIGDYTRKEVEKLARKFKLPVLKAGKSVEICFVKTTIDDFLRKHLKEKPGPVVEQVPYGIKKIVGQHQGLWFYTIGQRRGIKLPGGPYFVLDKDLKKNLLIVTRNEKDLLKKELICKNVNWVSGREPKFPLKIRAKIRYRHQPASAIITKNPEANTSKLVFSKPQRAITPGQSVVFYKGQEVLGGGIIC